MRADLLFVRLNKPWNLFIVRRSPPSRPGMFRRKPEGAALEDLPRGTEDTEYMYYSISTLMMVVVKYGYCVRRG